MKAPEPIRELKGVPRVSVHWAKRVLAEASRGRAEPGPTYDVWRWTGQKYRVRSIVLLLVDALLFAGLGCFTFWLRTGEYPAFTAQRYRDVLWAAFDPVRETQITLIDFLTYPIPVDQVPMMMVVVGLVLASLTAIPIMVAMLYRFPFSLIFTAIIAFVAVAPWLALTVTFCCWLATRRRLQFSFRYATALTALLPMVAYYLNTTRNAPVTEHLPPVEMAKLYMPWTLALVVACVVMAVVLLLARVVNYRPGAIAPLLAVMFATPVAVFEAKVGRDELYYRLLEKEVGPGSRTCFAGHVDAAEMVQRVAAEHFEAIAGPEPQWEDLVEQARLALQLQLACGRTRDGDVARLLAEDFASQRHVAIRQCRWFREHFPASRYVPNALYLEGRAIDMRLDRQFALFQGALILNPYADFPNAASRDTWRELAVRFPGSPRGSPSPLASVALLRLATLETRVGHVETAIAHLRELVERFSDYGEAQTGTGETGGWRGFLAKRPASGSLDVEPAAAVQEGRRLLDLLVNNRIIELEPAYDYPVLRRLLSLDPRHPMYRRNLQNLFAELATRKTYRETRLGDNLELLIVIADPSRSRRIDQLRMLIEKLEKQRSSDALPRARFELGSAYQADNLLDEARATFEAIRTAYPDSPWAMEAAVRLATMARPDA